MIQTQTILDVVDNTRARYVQCIKVFKGKYAHVGHVILVSIKKVRPVTKNQKIKVKKGQVCHALIVRTKRRIGRRNGISVQFSQNAVLLLTNKGVPMGSRAFGPTTQELREYKNFKIISLLSYLV